MSAAGNFMATCDTRSRKRTSLANREFQTTLIGAMGHDLRQSLQVIAGAYHRLSSRPQDALDRAWAERGQRAIATLVEQFNCLLDAFGLAAHDDAAVAPINLGAVLSKLGDELSDAAARKGVHFRVVSTDAYVVSNAVLMRSIIRNLLSNAIRCTPPGGRVLVGCRRKGADIEINVCDNGVGIAEDQLMLIFEPFTRLSTGDDGLGVGLAIVRHALEALGHRMEVRSVLGRGSIFSVYAPAVAVT